MTSSANGTKRNRRANSSGAKCGQCTREICKRRAAEHVPLTKESLVNFPSSGVMGAGDGRVCLSMCDL